MRKKKYKYILSQSLKDLQAFKVRARNMSLVQPKYKFIEKFQNWFRINGNVERVVNWIDLAGG